MGASERTDTSQVDKWSEVSSSSSSSSSKGRKKKSSRHRLDSIKIIIIGCNFCCSDCCCYSTPSPLTAPLAYRLQSHHIPKLFLHRSTPPNVHVHVHVHPVPLTEIVRLVCPFVGRCPFHLLHITPVSVPALCTRRNIYFCITYRFFFTLKAKNWIRLLQNIWRVSTYFRYIQNDYLGH